MALQAILSETADQSKTLDMKTFWGKPTVYPKVPIDKCKRRFIADLRAKTWITLDEVSNFHTEPELFYGPDEAAPLDRVETKTQEEQRAERNKQRREATKLAYDKAWRHWKESLASGLNLSAANDRAAAKLFIMLGAEGQRRYEQKLPHFDITEIQFGELWHQLDEVFLIKRNVTVDRFTFLSRK